MKKILILIFSLLLVSCTKTEYTKIGQEIVDGKVSAVQEGERRYCRSCIDIEPKIWVQNSTQTVEVTIPFEFDGRWKVGDSCLLIIEKYKENETKEYLGVGNRPIN